MNSKELSNTNWHFFHLRNRTPYFIYCMFRGPLFHSVEDLHTFMNVNGSCYNHILVKKESYLNYGNALWGKFKSNSKLILSEFDKAYEKNKNDIIMWKKLLKKDFSPLSNPELFEEYNSYSESLLSYGKYIYFPLSIEHLFEKEISKVLKDFSEHKRNNYYDIIMTPVKESSLVEERRSLLNLALILQDQGEAEEFKRKLSQHLEMFSFLKKKGLYLEFYSEDFYLEQIKKIKDPKKELDILNSSAKRRESDFSQLLDSFSDPFVKDLIITTNESIFFRSWRNERMIHSSYYVVPLFQELSKRLSLNEAKDLLYLYPFEVERILNQEIAEYKSLIKDRKNAFCFLTLSKDDQFMLQGEEAKDFCKKLKIFKQNESSLTGMPAYKGKVRGRVTIVHNESDYPKMKSAEIIVVHTTIPEMVPYIKDVKAIITEEGGILSHPAVISREFRIPCILGTGVATRILKNGDLVEVDAIEGKIKIIERK